MKLSNISSFDIQCKEIISYSFICFNFSYEFTYFFSWFEYNFSITNNEFFITNNSNQTSIIFPKVIDYISIPRCRGGRGENLKQRI
jgi:hypothetical protein